MRLFRLPDGVELLDDRVGELGMFPVDLGVDDGDQYVLAGRDLVHLAKAELARHVLLGAARARFRGSWPLRSLIQIVRLRDDALGFHRTHHIASRTVAADAEVN